ncbi:thylakoid lumenal 16.5 kDa protein, chloroplastic [Magnolia sinica]|uniref:thylakoid lumenal 16.5 kDa protein, chloroplastic n=1 Tax=Magnolia sinica TaxID=86752 RepID=UPI0026584DD9|nr:thylakoid lumenal 16.5 kDa protein, chloroplastic [Magnolia sinica]
MATSSILTKSFFPPLSSSPSSTSSSTTSLAPPSPNRKKPNSPTAVLCKAAHNTARRSLTVGFAALAASFAGKGFFDANAAVLEADDDVELLERVKKDRKKRLQRQEVISSSKKETAYLQELVYKLSKVGQAIENNDLSAASSVLGPNTNSDWVKNVNKAFTKLSSGPEEMTEVDTFNSSLASLISSVTKKDVESSKKAFVSSASALEKWTALTGLIAQLKGL